MSYTESQIYTFEETLEILSLRERHEEECTIPA